MSRGKQFALLLGGLLLVGLVGYFAYRSRPLSRPSYPPGPEAGLAWLPAEAAAVGAVDLEAVGQQQWFLQALRTATEGVAEDADYRGFVDATGFDYARDLDRLWFAAFAENGKARVAGVAEGRFAPGKIIAYARHQGATSSRYQNLVAYEWRRASAAGQPERRFAFAFLEDSRLAFAADAALLNRIIDCWLGRAPSVAADEKRRAELARLAAGQHAWVVLDPARWSPGASGLSAGQSDFTSVLTQASLGLRVTERQAELAAEARCHQPQACERLRDNLRIMALAARVALSRERNETSRALSDALSGLSVDVREGTLEARLAVPPQTLAALLRAAPGAVPQP
ncbi:MAG: hypothetical protein ACRD4D_00635 [Candidatus Acidiferrales bacterium]